MNEETKKRIDELVQSKKVFLFMKGSPDMPQCGFSMETIMTLKELGTEFGYFDVLTDEDIRQSIKEYANWPTIPQLYVNGKFVGGCDIVKQMFASGELKKILDDTHDK